MMPLRSFVKAALPPPIHNGLRRAADRLRYGGSYETMYEAHARRAGRADEAAIGDGPFDAIGRIERDLLLGEGLQPGHTLVDFGCGVGRLAAQVIPALPGGAYIGVDISLTMLKRAEKRIREAVPNPPCRVSWVKQTTPKFPFADNSVDRVCAFSVFTHREHEDSYQYLFGALRIVRPGGRFLFSCLPVNLADARSIFLQQAALDRQTRWSQVRNVAPLVDFMTEIAKMAGWTPLRWYDGDVANIGPPGGGEMRWLGQSTCVLEKPALSAGESFL